MAKTVRVSDELYSKLMAFAHKRNTSVAGVLDFLVEQGEKYLVGFEGLKNNLDLCPECGYMLHLHTGIGWHSHDAEFYEHTKVVNVKGISDDVYHLECIRCGYSIQVKRPEWRAEKSKTWDVRLKK